MVRDNFIPSHNYRNIRYITYTYKSLFFKEHMNAENCGMKYNNNTIKISLDRLETYEVGRCERRGEPEPSKIASSLVKI